MPAWLASGESPLPGLQMATFLLCPHMAWSRRQDRERESKRERGRRRQREREKASKL